jgi:long-chain acyl-CoA synthetase
MTAGRTMLERAALEPDAPALIDLSRSGSERVPRTMSWSEVRARTSMIANDLLRHGFGRGARLAVLGDNTGDTVLVYAAAVMAGIGAVYVNSHLTAEEVEYVLRDGNALAIWASPRHLATAHEAARRPGIPVLADNAARWESAPRTSDCEPPPSTDLPATTDLIYTSGTTGTPKGVEFPREPYASVREHLGVLARHHLAGQGTHLVVGPLYHAGPHAAVGLLLSGERVVVAGQFDADVVLDAIGRQQIATSVTVPTHLVRVLALPADRRAAADVSSLRTVALTGSSCPEPLKRTMIEWWGPVFRESYGGSESGIISYIGSEEWTAHPGSVGRPQPPFRALVLDEQGAECPAGHDGVLYFVDETGRGIRYYNDPEKTAAAHVARGTFTLGDIGHVDDEGYLYITGRTSDMVISGGVNVYPAECERLLTRHPSVSDVALFGVPDREMGERLVGMVCIRDDGSTVEQLLAYCRQSIASYKVPKELLRVKEIPRNPMGKLEKNALRAAYIRGFHG